MRFLHLIVVSQLLSCAGVVSALPEKKFSLRQTLKAADAVAVLRLENPKKVGDKWEVDLVVTSVIQAHPAIKLEQVVGKHRFTKPLPAQILAMIDVFDGKIEVYQGLEASAPVVDYASRIIKLDSEKPRENLRFFFDYIDHVNVLIRDDAVFEFESASRDDLAAVARELPPEKIRAAVRNPKVEGDQLRLYAYLLSYRGEPKDADVLAKRMEKEPNTIAGRANKRAFFLPLVTLNPEAYVPNLQAIARDKSASFLERFAVLMAFRHVHEARPDLHKRVDGVKLIADLVEVPDIADFAIEDLRRWKRWEFTDRVLSKDSKAGYDTPLLRKTILRFALQAPGQAAAAHVDKARKKSAEWVEEVKELLELEAAPK